MSHHHLAAGFGGALYFIAVFSWRGLIRLFDVTNEERPPRVSNNPVPDSKEK
jgi:hypothetical protein